jgi:TonB family protein
MLQALEPVRKAIHTSAEQKQREKRDSEVKTIRQQAARLTSKKVLIPAAGLLLILILVFVIEAFTTRTEHEPASVVAVIPTPTVETTVVSEPTSTVVAVFTETPLPEPTETATAIPTIPLIPDTPLPTPISESTLTPTPDDTPVPTETPVPTVTPTYTPPPIQPGIYVEHPDVSPEIVSRVRPDMPSAARHMGVEGNVTLRVLVSETGEVLDVNTIAASDQLERSGCVKAARDAVKKWVFQPATHQGIPVKTHYTLVVPFRRR